LAARNTFTTSDSFKGVVSFLPAYPTSEPEILAEVLTPHPNAAKAAAGDEEPHPIFFPAVREGSCFGFAILAAWLPPMVEVDEVLNQANEWLQEAVTTNGIGAKTGAGYGWLAIDPEAEVKRRETMQAFEQKARAQAETEARDAAEKRARADRLAAMSPEEQAAESVSQLNQEQFAEFARKLPEKSEMEQRGFLKVLLTKEHKETRKRWQKNKPDIWNPVSQTASKLQILLP
jgi:hypothetical protein